MLNVVLYTNGCPKCKVLEQKLQDKAVDYEVCKNQAAMLEKGFLSAPMLEVDGETMDFITAIQWVNELKPEEYEECE